MTVINFPAPPFAGPLASERKRRLPTAAPEVPSAPIDAAPQSAAGVDWRARFEGLRDQAREATAAGDLTGALTLLEEAEEAAQLTGDPELRDLALCNRAALAVELDQADDLVEPLRAVLSEDRKADTSMLAAYQLGRAFELAGDARKACYYARLACDRSNEGISEGIEPAHRAAARNLLGNSLLAEHQTAEAVPVYLEALALMPAADEVRRAQVVENLGYCLLLDGALDRALPLLWWSLRTQRRYGALRSTISTHIDLCFAHLERGRPAQARRHGERALALATEFEDTRNERHALYLLGEVAAEEGNERLAFEWFQELQQRFYPEDPQIAGRLLAVGMRSMVNFKA